MEAKDVQKQFDSIEATLAAQSALQKEVLAKLTEQNTLQKEVLDFNETAKYLALSKSHLYKLTSSGKIPHYKPESKKIYFSRAELDKWMLRNPVRTAEQTDLEANKYINQSKKKGGLEL